MADEKKPNEGDGGTQEPDYKALYEKSQKDVEKWKAMSRKNEERAKGNAGAASELEGANAQLADVLQRLNAIEGENAKLKADAARSALVAKVAAATGVPEAIVSMLAPSDEEALTDAAKAILSAYQPGGAPKASEAGKVQRSDGQDDGGDWLREALLNS